MASPSRLSQSLTLRIAASVFATLFIGFGINALLNPTHALTFFEMAPPSSPYDKTVVDALMAVYGVRDIFMGVAIYAAAYYGESKSLGWIVLSGSAVAFADGAICKMAVGKGEWGHWGYAPMLTAVGSALLGVFDRA